MGIQALSILASSFLLMGSACTSPATDGPDSEQASAASDGGSEGSDSNSDEGGDSSGEDTEAEVVAECENDENATSEAVMLCIDGMV